MCPGKNRIIVDNILLKIHTYADLTLDIPSYTGEFQSFIAMMQKVQKQPELLLFQNAQKQEFITMRSIVVRGGVH